MAVIRSCFTGFEVNSLLTSGVSPDGINVSNAAIVTTTPRTGTYCLELTANASQRAWYVSVPNGGAVTFPCSYRASIYLTSTTISSAFDLLTLANTSGARHAALRLSTSRTLQLVDNAGNAQGAASSAIASGQWHEIEIRTKDGAGATRDVEWLLNGQVIATNVNISDTNHSNVQHLYIAGSPTNSDATIRADDVVCAYDDSGTAYVEIGPSKVVLLAPISDSQVGSWTGGSGGTTNLYDAVNNTPPIGTASETNTTQIENADTSPDNSTDEYRPNLTSYSTAGIVSGDTIKAVRGWVCHGEDVATGTKTGSARILTNPVDSGVVTFDYGDNVGALGTYPTNWRWKATNIVENPSVTLGTSPTMALRKTDTGSRVASCCFMGAYVEYQLAVGGVVVNPFSGRGGAAAQPVW